MKKSVPPVVATAVLSAAALVEAREVIGEDTSALAIVAVFAITVAMIARKEPEP